MTLRRILLLVGGCFAVIVLVMAAMIWQAVRENNAWKEGPGETVIFRVEGGRVDERTIIQFVKSRLGNTRAIVREAGPSRLSLWIPLSDTQRDASAELKTAMNALDGTSPAPGAVDRALALSGAEQVAAFDAIAPAGSSPRTLLEELKAATAESETVQKKIASFGLGAAPDDLRLQAFNAGNAEAAARDRLLGSFFYPGQLDALLAAADDGDAAACATRDGLAAAFPAQAKEIRAVIAARGKWRAAGGGVHPEPDDIERVLCARGLVEFRIAVTPEDVGFPSGQDYLAAIESLEKEGPATTVTVGGTRARWFEIAGNRDDNFRATCVIQSWAGAKFILCYDDTFHTLTHSDPARKPWSMRSSAPYTQPGYGGRVVPFTLDNVGAKYMGRLSADNKGHPLCILIDNRAVSAPTVQSQITDAGVITFGLPSPGHPDAAIRKEANELHAVLSSDPLPAPIHRIQ